jgi:hypothetical protein
MPKRTPEQILRAIENPSPEEEIERALAMTNEEVNRELAAAGYTAEELEAQEEALLGPAAPRAAAPQSLPTKPAPEPWYRRYGGAFAVAAAVEFLGLGWASGIIQDAMMTTTSPVDDAHVTRSMTHEAAGECAAHSFARCIAILDELEARVPAAGKDPVVQGLREGAKAGLRSGAEGGAGVP